MKRLSTCNVVDAMRFDMSLHGARFIILEFVTASVIVAGVVLLSVLHLVSTHPSVWLMLWTVSFLGILINCIIILMLAMRIRKKEGNRPVVMGKVDAKFIAVMLTLFIITPYLLPFIACRQVKSEIGSKQL